MSDKAFNGMTNAALIRLLISKVGEVSDFGANPYKYPSVIRISNELERRCKRV